MSAHNTANRTELTFCGGFFNCTYRGENELQKELRRQIGNKERQVCYKHITLLMALLSSCFRFRHNHNLQSHREGKESEMIKKRSVSRYCHLIISPFWSLNLSHSSKSNENPVEKKIRLTRTHTILALGGWATVGLQRVFSSMLFSKLSWYLAFSMVFKLLKSEGVKFLPNLLKLQQSF